MPESDSYVDHFTELAPEGIGYLTWDEFDKLRRAVTTAQKHVPWWRVAGYVKVVHDPDELGRKPPKPAEFPLGLPPTWLAAEEISRLLHEINQWPQLEDVASDRLGSELAILLIREVETAAAKWPMDDRPRRVRFFRCQACDQMTLRYYPPKDGDRPDAPRVEAVVRGAGRQMGSVDLMDSVIRCTAKECGAMVDEAMFMRMAIMAEAEKRDRDERARQLAAGKRGSSESESDGADDLPLGETGPDSDDAAGGNPVAVLAGSVES